MNGKGFSLIETMVSLSISMIGILAVLSMTATSLKSERNTASLQDFSVLKDTIRMFLSNPNLCPETLLKIGTHSLDLSGETIAIDTRLQSGSVITDVNLEIIAPTGGLDEYSAYVNIEGNRNQYTSGAPLPKIRIPITVVRDTNGVIGSCQLTSYTTGLPSPTPSVTPIVLPTPDYATICVAMGGTWTTKNKNYFYCQL